MIIGGNDVIVPVGMNIARMYSLLSLVRMWWPQAHLVDALDGKPLQPPLTMPCELLVYRDLGIRRLSEAHGVVPEVEPYFFSIIAQLGQVTFVVGPEGSEGDRIVQDLRRLIGCFG